MSTGGIRSEEERRKRRTLGVSLELGASGGTGGLARLEAVGELETLAEEAVEAKNGEKPRARGPASA